MKAFGMHWYLQNHYKVSDNSTMDKDIVFLTILSTMKRDSIFTYLISCQAVFL